MTECRFCDERAPKAHRPCCSTHSIPLCCEHYCRMHFVEVNKCTPQSHVEAPAHQEVRDD